MNRTDNNFLHDMVLVRTHRSGFEDYQLFNEWPDVNNGVMDVSPGKVRRVEPIYGEVMRVYRSGCGVDPSEYEVVSYDGETFIRFFIPQLGHHGWHSFKCVIQA